MARTGFGRRRGLLVPLAAAALVALVGCGDDAATTTEPGVTSTVASGAITTGPAATTTLKASLTGGAEVPGPGDGAGSGSATVTVEPANDEVCYQLTVSGIAPADKAHIHRGPPDQAGPVVVSFTPPADGSSEGCVALEKDLLQQIAAGPEGFYVNVHNGPYPAGAVRGQLVR